MNPIEDILKHKDDEIIAYLARVSAGVLKNYNTAITSKTPEIIWSCFGDIALLAGVLKGMDKKNKDKLAPLDE